MNTLLFIFDSAITTPIFHTRVATATWSLPTLEAEADTYLILSEFILNSTKTIFSICFDAFQLHLECDGHAASKDQAEVPEPGLPDGEQGLPQDLQWRGGRGQLHGVHQVPPANRVRRQLHVHRAGLFTLWPKGRLSRPGLRDCSGQL